MPAMPFEAVKVRQRPEEAFRDSVVNRKDMGYAKLITRLF